MNETFSANFISSLSRHKIRYVTIHTGAGTHTQIHEELTRFPSSLTLLTREYPPNSSPHSSIRLDDAYNSRMSNKYIWNTSCVAFASPYGFFLDLHFKQCLTSRLFIEKFKRRNKNHIRNIRIRSLLLHFVVCTDVDTNSRMPATSASMRMSRRQRGIRTKHFWLRVANVSGLQYE